ncbi:MAG: single-stranded-DNA-specific exonuclease RecJ [Candidatus Peregrinibacteria bacterium]
MSLLGKKWVIQNERLDLELLDVLLANRQVTGEEERRQFFEGDLKLVHEPDLLPDMGKAIERILKAVVTKEKVMVFGDYDIDGITGTALLYDFLKKVGANVHATLPNREEDGYGLKNYFVERFAREGVKLLITVDCGTSNVTEVALAKKLGMEVIVTDHHSMSAQLPPALAIINPHRKDSKYPFPDICGSTIAYKLVTTLSRELMKEKERKEYLMKQLSVVTLGIIGDCMPLTNENRVLVKYGLKSLRDGHNPGLVALLEAAGLEIEKVTSFTIGFQLGPRLNAAGRMDKPDHALELILGNLDKAEVLNHLNKLRQEVVKGYLEEAVKMVEKQKVLPPLLVVWSKTWKAGLLGLIAAHLAETYNRPAIVMQEREEELVASCRSVSDFDLTSFLRREVGELCTSLGGHKMAGGLTLPKKQLEPFVDQLRKAAKKHIKTETLTDVLPIDCELEPHELTLETCAALRKLEPFGTGNPEPTLILRNTRILSVRPVGKTGEHLQFPVECGGKKHAAIAFRMGEHADKIDPKKTYDIAFTMEVNEWNGNRKLQLKVVDLKPSTLPS